jgi:hypothetical protein
MTGGEAFYLTNGIAAAMRKAVDDAEVIYTLGFYPGSDELDGDFHELRVEVRPRNVDVRHRRGYFGFDPPNPSDTVDGRTVNDLVVSPINATAIGLVASREAVTDGESATRLAVDLNDLDLAFVDGAWTGTVEIATLIVEPGAADAGIRAGNLDIRLTDEQFLDAIADGGYELFRVRNDDRGAWLRAVVREPTSGAAGSLWVELR